MINIKVLGTDWSELWTFAAEKGKTITTLAKENNVEIHTSCWMWVCWLCLCEIEKGWEYINKAYTMPLMMELWDAEVLTCVAAIKDECFDNDIEAEVVIKRTF